MKHQSPFSLDRFEYESEHLYFLPPAYDSLRLPKPAYIVGSRGTGKTTLLKAMDWHERLHNSSLKTALRTRNEPPLDFIGVYFKLPDIQLAVVDHWLTAAPTELRASAIALYLDLLSVESIFNALAELTLGPLPLPIPTERTLIATLAARYPHTFSSDPDFTPSTLRDVANQLGRVRRNLECSARFERPLDTLASLDALGAIGHFARDCTRTLTHAFPSLHFKVCMDEGESLTDFQQLVLNTMVRLAEAPLYYTVAFVSVPLSGTATLRPSLTLSTADRALIALDREDSLAEFQALVEGVAAVRCRHYLRSTNTAFSLDTFLGPLRVNRLLEDILRASVSPVAHKLLSDARTLAMHPFFGEHEYEEGLPIYQAYLLYELDISLPSPNTSQWARRRQDSAELRKRMVAAYLSICNDIKTEPRYESAQMLLQLSDSCVRDSLHQLDHVVVRLDGPLSTLLRSCVPSKIQHDALRAASIEKQESFFESGVTSPLQTSGLVSALGALTARLQRSSPNKVHLRSSERGIFRLPAPGLANLSHQNLERLVLEASEAGFLRIVERTAANLRFRLHCSLAAAFGFSYRGAYYDCNLRFDDVALLIRGAELGSMDENVRAVADRLNGTAEILPLFPNHE